MHQQEAVSQYLSQMQNQLSPEYLQAVGTPLIEVSQLIETKLQNGDIQVSPPRAVSTDNLKAYERPIVHRQLQRITQEKRQCQEELEQLNQQFSKFDSIQKNLQQNRLQARRIARQMEEHKRQQFMQKAKNNIKQWEREKQQLQQKKREVAQRHKRLMQQMEREENVKKMREELQKKEQKKKQYEELMKQIEDRRRKRSEIQRKQAQRPHEVPKFVQIIEKYKSQQEELKFQREFQKKKQKTEKQINFAKINEHEKNYMSQVKRHHSTVVPASHSTDFSLYRTSDQKKQDVQKMKRRQGYQAKLKQIPVTINDQKQLQTEILRDKTKNPFKYIFLGQKGLSDFQIFEEFKDFNIEQDPKKLGVQYLNQQKEKHKQIIEKLYKEKRSKSVDNLNYRKPEKTEGVMDGNKNSVASGLQPTDKLKNKKYENYLPSLGLKKLDQIESIVKARRDKPSKINMLIERSSELEDQALRKIQKFKNQLTGTYTESIKMEDDIDKLYLKALKTKLACAQLAI